MNPAISFFERSFRDNFNRELHDRIEHIHISLGLATALQGPLLDKSEAVRRAMQSAFRNGIFVIDGLDMEWRVYNWEFSPKFNEDVVEVDFS